jgi:hypothetical protein
LTSQIDADACRKLCFSSADCVGTAVKHITLQVVYVCLSAENKRCLLSHYHPVQVFWHILTKLAYYRELTLRIDHMAAKGLLDPAALAAAAAAVGVSHHAAFTSTLALAALLYVCEDSNLVCCQRTKHACGLSVLYWAAAGTVSTSHIGTLLFLCMFVCFSCWVLLATLHVVATGD